VKIPVTALVLLLTGSIVEASVPLPRPRPAAEQPSVPSPPLRPSLANESTPGKEATQTGPAEQPSENAKAPPQPSACQIGLRAIAVFAPSAPVDGAGDCGIADPVRLEAVILANSARVAISPPAMLRCEMATAVAHWVRDDMVPAAARLGSGLRGIENFDSYDCRGRNRVFGAKMSEHGRGNALDIKAVKLESGVTAHLTDAHVTKAVRDELRQTACTRFTTVLGPGSDGYHENHVHVDLAERRSGYRICQWEVRQPLDRVSPSPHIVSSRTPTPLEMMQHDNPTVPASNTVPLPPRRADRR
jgi:hypothetical protein